MVRLQQHRRQHGWTCPQPSPSVCSRCPHSCLAMMRMKMRHTHTCHSHCCINCRTQPLLLNQLLNASVSSSKPQLIFHFPMERFFTRRAGPPVTAWQERRAEEDFFALVRHNAATKLEMERWPPALKKRRVGKPSLDEQYTRALCDWMATLVGTPRNPVSSKSTTGLVAQIGNHTIKSGSTLQSLTLLRALERRRCTQW